MSYFQFFLRRTMKWETLRKFRNIVLQSTKKKQIFMEEMFFSLNHKTNKNLVTKFALTGVIFKLSPGFRMKTLKRNTGLVRSTTLEIDFRYNPCTFSLSKKHHHRFYLGCTVFFLTRMPNQTNFFKISFCLKYRTLAFQQSSTS